MRKHPSLELVFIAWLATLGAAAVADAQQTNPVELGRVAWLRNFDQAHAAAAKSKKPILLLFQEVPG